VVDLSAGLIWTRFSGENWLLVKIRRLIISCCGRFCLSAHFSIVLQLFCEICFMTFQFLEKQKLMLL